MPIYIVCIGDKHYNIQDIGAIYSTEKEARAEVERLLLANKYTKAYYIVRHIRDDNAGK